MNIQLTDQQQQALDSQGGAPPRVIDPRTSAAYVLVPESEYLTVQELLEDERYQQALRTVARRNAAGRLDEAP